MQDPEIETKLFSLEEAKETLPLVRPIVTDLMECHDTLKELMDRKRSGESSSSRTDAGNKPDEDLLDKIDSQKSELSEYLDEIYSLGAEFQGFDSGWVNFPSRLENRIVYLCWKPGDKEISFWHETYTECNDRKPIEEQNFRGE